MIPAHNCSALLPDVLTVDVGHHAILTISFYGILQKKLAVITQPPELGISFDTCVPSLPSVVTHIVPNMTTDPVAIAFAPAIFDDSCSDAPPQGKPLPLVLHSGLDALCSDLRYMGTFRLAPKDMVNPTELIGITIILVAGDGPPIG